MTKTKLLLLGMILVSFSPLNAMTPEAKGLDIAQKIDAHDQGWGSQVANVVMVLRNRHGQESKRKMVIKSLEDTIKGDDMGDKALTLFKTPKDVKGTSFLSFTHTEGPDEQWLYLPALRRVKQIASDNKSGPFMGSEFAFEDISTQEVGKYTYKFLRDEFINKEAGFVFERYPVDKKSGYTKQVVWVDAIEYRIHKIDFYNRRNAFFKTLTYERYAKYTKNIWRPSKMAMVNHITGKSTELIWNNYAFNKKLSVRDFDKNALKRLK
ncbi:outer membrane lipoprotein-sorting protein [bacterium]|jgi:hypothetical protein|nr:outer membrane lipoprotein-sorting protein [bacterium]